MLKVLFISSGNSKNFDIIPFILSQGEALTVRGLDIEYFTITGKGISGYIRSIFKIRRILKNQRFDLIHAHYILSAWSAVFAFPEQPIVLSLMGTDACGVYVDFNKIKFSSRFLIILTYLIQPFVNAIICKSKNIERSVYLKNKSWVIPNGILLEQIDNDGLLDEDMGLRPGKKYVLFLGNPKSRRKNFQLLQKAVDILNSTEVVIVSPYPVPHNKVLKYLKSVDVLVVPSLMEGSPNVVKEAMACNCPVVGTDVGDIAWVFGKEPGYFLTSFDPQEMAEKIRLALQFAEQHGRTQGLKELKN